MAIKVILLTGLYLVAASFSGNAHEKPLPFLQNIKEFSDFSLSITEGELKLAIASRGIYSIRSENDTGASYQLTTASGENLIVGFNESGKCGGIQRLMPTPKVFIEKQIGQAAYKKWMKNLEKLRLAKERANKLRAKQSE